MSDPNNNVTAAAIGLSRQRAALVRAGGGWSLPAAPVARGGLPQPIARDALQQQVGLPAAIDRLSGVYSGDEGLLIVYTASLDSGEPRAGVSFFAPNELPAPIEPPLHAAALADWAASYLHGFSTTRYCPRCGGARLSAQEKYGRPRMTCATCGYIFFRDPKVGAGVFIEEDGRVLLIRRGVNPGMDLWCLPSGFVEHDESPEKAAVREAKEETGLDVRLGALMGLHSYWDAARGNGILILYHAQAAGGALAPGDDAKEARYFSRQELPPPEQIAFRTHRIVLDEWQRR
ncbi:MAG: NUDIX domain-containing protein [Chloroflexi bacterium]|nr:NUDIX domain-containing protein [Chloroflexota bacterium]